MSTQGGQGWRKGGDHHVKRGFLQGSFFINRFIALTRFRSIALWGTRNSGSEGIAEASRSVRRTGSC